VLEREYLVDYVALPLTAAAAVEQGWTVEDACQQGLGRSAEGPFKESLHLWFDRAGDLMGYGARVPSGATAPWRRVGDHFELDLIFRDPEAACGQGPAAEPGSIGDRVLVSGGDGTWTALPQTRDEALAAGDFIDAGPCWTDMGYHIPFRAPGADPQLFSPAVPMHTGDGSRLTGINTPTGAEQLPPFEHFAPDHGGPAYGLHLYFIDHRGVCGGSPTLAPFPPAAPVAV
jgi:hypothetical protein